MAKYKDPDDYLASLPIEKRAVLEDLRATIHLIVPDAEEMLVYGVPGFKYKGKSLCAYASFKQHFGFYPMSEGIIERYADALKDFKTSKGTVQFTTENPISKQLLQNLIEARIAEI